MPVYEYQHVITGQKIEAFRPVAQRDDCPPGYHRITAPSRVAVLVGAVAESDPIKAVPRALQELEGKHSAREIAKQAGFTVEQLKETWAT